MATQSNLEKYYNKFHEEHRLTTRHGRVEFTTTLSLISECIEKIKTEKKVENQNIKIADIGAGTGRYSVKLCHMGCDVTAVELVKHNLEILRSKHENIKTWQGNAMDLHFLPDETFDITLVFGPMYHLHGDENKVTALKEARRVTKKDGYILVAYVMNEYSVISYCFREHKIGEVLEKGGLSSDFHVLSTEEDLYDYVRLEDINRLNQKAGFNRVDIASADGPSDYIRRELNEMSEEEFQTFIKFHLATCRRPELLGAGSHIVDVVKKNLGLN